MATKTETIEYKDDNVTLRSHLAYDDQKAGKRPGVLVMPGAFGQSATAIFSEPGAARRRMRVGLDKLASLPNALTPLGLDVGGGT
jgi:dienelactone hydrolase